MPKFHVGQRIWQFNPSHRIYDNNHSGPIYEKHFVPTWVIEVQPRSYILGQEDGSWPHKIGITKAESIYYDDQGKDDKVWANAHHYKIGQLVDRADAATLRMIAEILGYKS